ncbi:aromatic prenyltransferase [Colletotrichum nymphaeae SA-01]|uniref:Aromatic prenyltransferase n=1 Tax=Colletotrichum nymphaeae SA-01 TaxID=1460502 RepID=A0A135U9J9_9PEZI|nr:aromatic prenyltransferase [Colletotrichum nymphaeae SA-01]
MSTASSQTITVPPENAVGGEKATDYWSHYFTSVLTRLFSSVGGYTPSEQQAQIDFMRKHVAPVIGPVPAEPYGLFNMPYIPAPLEASVNLTTNGQPKARIWMNLGKPLDQSRFEPQAAERDSENLLSIARASRADTRWLECLTKAMILTSAQLEAVRARGGPAWPYSLFCFDFTGMDRTMRAYFPAVPRGGRSRTEVGLDAVKSLEPFAPNLQAGLNLVQSYLNGNRYKAAIHLLGVDCLDPEQARVKIYLDVNSNSWNAARDVMTLGGRLTDAISLKAVDVLQSVYHLMRDEPEGGDEDWSKPNAIADGSFPGQQFSVEITAKSSIPEMKIYVPLVQYAGSPQRAEENMYHILRKLGHQWASNGKLKETMMAVGESETVRGLGVITFSYSEKKGSYSSIYFAPPTDYVDKVAIEGRSLSVV